MKYVMSLVAAMAMLSAIMPASAQKAELPLDDSCPKGCTKLPPPPSTDPPPDPCAGGCTPPSPDPCVENCPTDPPPDPCAGGCPPPSPDPCVENCPIDPPPNPSDECKLCFNG